MMLGTIYHIIVVGYKIFVLRVRMTMLPSLQDGMDAVGAFLYNIGLRKHRPQMGRYTFEEKAEYWAFVWGAVVMGFTGFLMWNPILATNLLPGEFVPAAKAAHGGEAPGCASHHCWHMYVHPRLQQGHGPAHVRAEMLHDILSISRYQIRDRRAAHRSDALRKRQRIYAVAFVLTVIMLAGVCLAL
jgi:cytochrome b subunit of formate dehydrogenase